MAGALMDKVWSLIGMENTEPEEENPYENMIDDEEVEDEVEDRKIWGRRNNSKVLNMQATQQVKMVISQPTSFEQSEAICDLLKEKKSVIVNLEYVNKDIARRIVDVVSGAVHALDGHKIGRAHV